MVLCTRPVEHPRRHGYDYENPACLRYSRFPLTDLSARLETWTRLELVGRHGEALASMGGFQGVWDDGAAVNQLYPCARQDTPVQDMPPCSS